MRAAFEVTTGDQPVDEDGRRGGPDVQLPGELTHTERFRRRGDVVQRQQVRHADPGPGREFRMHRGRGLQQAAKLLADFPSDSRRVARGVHPGMVVRQSR